MPSPIENYLAARKNVNDSELSASKLAEIVANGGREMQQDWKRVIVTNTNPETRFPLELWERQRRANKSHDIDANTWPTAGKIAQAFAAFHKAKGAEKTAWEAIPKEQRTGLQPPA